MAIQFKRALNFNGSLNEAINKLNTTLDPRLQPGEPLLCSYNDNGNKKYLIAIGITDGNIRIIPSFTNEDELKEYIHQNSAGINIKDNISFDSDISVSTDLEGKMILKVKDNLKNIWIDLNNE